MSGEKGALDLRMRFGDRDPENPVEAASFALDCAAIAYGQARLDKNYPALSRLVGEMKVAAIRLVEALRAEDAAK